MRPHRILVVDDESKIRESLSGLFQEHGYEVMSASSGAECLRINSAQPFDLVILDIVMLEMDGIETLRKIKEQHKDTEVIMISGYADKGKAISALRHNAYDLIEKPFESTEILNRVANCLNQWDLKREAERNAQELAQAEAKYRDLYDNAPNMYLALDMNGIITECNQTWVARMGYSKKEMVGQTVSRFLTKQSRDDFLRALSEIVKKERRMGIERELITKKGDLMKVIIDATPILDEEGDFGGIRTTMVDITERKKMEEELIRLSDAMRMSTECIVISDVSGKVTDVNEAALKMYGTDDKADLIGRSFFDSIAPEDRERGSAAVDELMQKGSLTDQKYHLVKKDGTRIPVEMSASVMLGADGAPIGLVGITRDISERVRAEKALVQASEFWQGTFDSIGDMLAIIDKDRRVVRVNQAMAEVFHDQNVLGAHCYEVFHDTKKPLLNCLSCQVFSSGEPAHFERKEPHLGDRWFDITAYPMRDKEGSVSQVVHIVRDITKRKEMELQFQQAQKMEAIGTLAGGVAHDFNNILTIILGYSQLTLRAMREDDPLHKNMKTIEQASKRAGDLTRQLLLFSRKVPMEKIVFDLNKSAHDLTKMLNRLLGEDVVLTTELGSALGRIKGDPGSLEQVLMNLTVNARDAIPGGGKVVIRTEKVQVDQAYCSLHSDAHPGEFVCLSILDTGAGMDQATKDRIFEPFFTTKGLGKGTGLGLSVVYGIVAQHQGWITVQSVPGEGTTFMVYLPAFFEEQEEEDPETCLSLEAARGHGERILLVEDEESIRDFSARVLSENGYAVFSAGTVQEALVQFEQEAGSFDLLFCDVVLPDGRGHKLVARLLGEKPGIPVLFTSGYSDERSEWEAIREAGHPYLQKPYAIFDLLNAVRDAIQKIGTQ
ncbi:MAG: PAS domain S-box protein [Candidatus Latescibacterota bacterium]